VAPRRSASTLPVRQAYRRATLDVLAHQPERKEEAMSSDIPIDRLREHPRNSNAMSAEALRTLRRHIRRSGRYEPLVVRPLPPSDDGAPTYQVLNGHHRLRVLRDLGHAAVRCEVWDVDDREALLLLATLNRLEGRDEPMKRAALLSELASGSDHLGRLVELLPEDQAALDKALALAREPLPAPRLPAAAPPVFEPLTFFLSRAELVTVDHALSAAVRASREARVAPEASASRAAPPARGRARAAALVALAERYLTDERSP
jgi:ParB-like chromosome segregation protein Spo0J